MEVVSSSTSSFSKSHCVHSLFSPEDLFWGNLLLPLLTSQEEIFEKSILQSSIHPCEKSYYCHPKLCHVCCFHQMLCVILLECCSAPTAVFSLHFLHKNLVRTSQMNYFTAPIYVYILKLCEGRQSRRSHEESSSSRVFL